MHKLNQGIGWWIANVLLVASFIMAISVSVSAATFECTPGIAKICGPGRCEASSVGAIFKVENGNVYFCQDASCSKSVRFHREDGEQWAWLSAGGTWISIYKPNGVYVRSLNIGLGALVEHGTCVSR